MKILILGLLLLPTLSFGQEYVFNGISEIKVNFKEKKLSENIIPKKANKNCYDSNNVGKIGTWEGCNGLLIVNNSMLRNRVNNGEIYADDVIFTGQVTNINGLLCKDPYACRYDKSSLPYSIEKWDVSNVTKMDHMFYDNRTFDTDLTEWCVEKIKEKPYGFDLDAYLPYSKQPLWGSCP